MKIYTLILSTALFLGCTTTSNQVVDIADTANVEFDDNDKVVVCGEVDGEKQTYPTLGELKNDGAKLLYYGPCYSD